MCVWVCVQCAPLTGGGALRRRPPEAGPVKPGQPPFAGGVRQATGTQTSVTYSSVFWVSAGPTR